MKDQNTIEDNETQDQKWNRGLDLYIESVHKPDHVLRACAHNQQCYDELMEIRDLVIEMVHALPNPHKPNLKFGAKNDHVEPTTMTPHGEISNTLLRGALGDYYRKQISEEL